MYASTTLHVLPASVIKASSQCSCVSPVGLRTVSATPYSGTMRSWAQWQSSAELDVLEEPSDFPPFSRFYTHVMLNMAPVMSQGTFEDRERTRWIDRRRLVRVIVQTGRRDE